MLRATFTLLTGGALWVPMLEEFALLRGHGRDRVLVRGVAPTGDMIARDPDGAVAVLAEAAREAVRDGAGVVVLGGAGLAGLAAKLKPMVDAPLLDGVACAISMAEGLALQKPAKAVKGALAKPGGVDSIKLSKGLSKLLQSP